MKNLLKTGMLAICVAVSVVSCDPPKADSEKSPVDTVKKSTDTAKSIAVDTVKKDSVKK